MSGLRMVSENHEVSASLRNFNAVANSGHIDSHVYGYVETELTVRAG